MITEDYLTDIADAIRAKNGSSDTYTPPQMAAAIAAIPTGGDVDVEALSVTANGTYTAPTGKAYSPVAVNVSGGGGESATIQAIAEFTPDSNANTARSAGIQITPLYDLKCVGIRFWARDSLCNVYVSDTGGNTIASKQNAAVTAGQWNDVLFDTPVVLNTNTTYVIWGSNQSSAMRYVNTSSLWSQFVTIGAAKYTTTLDTFPTSSEPGAAKYGANLLFEVSF